MSVLSFSLFLLFACCSGDTFHCKGEQSCKDEIITCNSHQPCTIHCNGLNSQQACQATVINASSATDVTLHCYHTQDCYDTELHCGSGTCDIICHTNNDKQQCKFKSVECGSGPCTIACKGEDSCDDSDFISPPLECFGYCPSTFPAASIPSSTEPTATTGAIQQSVASSSVHLSVKPSVSSPIDPTTSLLSGSTAAQTTFKSNQNSEQIIIKINPVIVLLGVLLVLLICLSSLGAIYLLKRKQDKKPEHAATEKNVSLEQTYSNYANVSECVLFMEGETNGERLTVEGGEGERNNAVQSKLAHLRTPSNSLSDIDIELGENEFIVRGDSEDIMVGENTEGQ